MLKKGGHKHLRRGSRSWRNSLTAKSWQVVMSSQLSKLRIRSYKHPLRNIKKKQKPLLTRKSNGKKTNSNRRTLKPITQNFQKISKQNRKRWRTSKQRQKQQRVNSKKQRQQKSTGYLNLMLWRTSSKHTKKDKRKRRIMKLTKC